MSLLMKLQFEGKPFTTTLYKGQPCWIAREVGVALGYSDGGRRLVNKVGKEWADEFIEGRDYTMIVGEELKQFRELAEVDTDSVSTYAPQILVLYESGIHLVLAKTAMPAGRRLRRFLVDKVLPQLVRDGSYSPEREVVSGQIVAREPDNEQTHLQLVADLEDRRFKSEWLVRLVERLESRDRVAPDVADAYWVVAAEIATGLQLSSLKPQVEDDWLSPTAMAERTGVPLHVVGRVISQLGLRGNYAGVCKAIVNKAKAHDRTVTSYLYSPRAVAQIEAALMPARTQTRMLGADANALGAG